MRIIRLKDGFAESQERRKAQFFAELGEFKNFEVWFRGSTESGPFHLGNLKEYDGLTVTFENAKSDYWIYPYWEVMIAMPES